MLHGEIKVNEKVIGVWVAVRMVHPPQKVNPYRVEVSYQDPEGVVHTHSGQVHHEYGKGALELASEVLAWVANEDAIRRQIEEAEGVAT